MTDFGKNSLSNLDALKMALVLTLFWCLIRILGVVSEGLIEESGVGALYILKRTLPQFLVSFVSFYLIFLYDFHVFRQKYGLRRKFALSILVSIVIAFVISGVFLLLKRRFFPAPEMLAHKPPAGLLFPGLFLLTGAIIITAIAVLITYLLYITKEREKTIVENQNLTVENIRTRYEALKSQINPHFLFNSLNTLNGLIGEDDAKAQEYVQYLSSVFRYTMQKKEITTLQDELEFTGAFCQLMNIRYGDSLTVEYDIAPEYLSRSIMPLSVQMLIENAIKHNTISKKYPMRITIATTQHGTIRVANAIQPKSEYVAGEGIGLANLAERYRILYGREISISESDGVFSVEAPLI